MAIDISNWFTRTKNNSGARPSGKQAEKQRAVNLYHAIGIVPGLSCCKAVAEQKNRRYLAGTVPKIPLPSCSARSCSCRYAHYQDRRDGGDRRGMGVQLRNFSLPERRRGRGNRVTDWP